MMDGKVEEVLAATQMEYTPNSDAPHITKLCCRVCGEDAPDHTWVCSVPAIMKAVRELESDAALWRAAQGVEVTEIASLLDAFASQCRTELAEAIGSEYRKTAIENQHYYANQIKDAFRAQAAALLAAERERDELNEARQKQAARYLKLMNSTDKVRGELAAATAESVRLAGEVEAAEINAKEAWRLYHEMEQRAKENNVCAGQEKYLRRMTEDERDALRRAVEAVVDSVEIYIGGDFIKVPQSILRGWKNTLQAAPAPAHAAPHADEGTGE
jgi:hypothetical protein